MSAMGRNQTLATSRLPSPAIRPEMRHVRSFSRRRRKGGGGGKKLPPWAVTGVLAAAFVAVAVCTQPTIAKLPFSYPNCDAARAGGVAPMNRGEPGYRAPLDADSDGV